MTSFDIETKVYITQTDVVSFTVETSKFILFKSASFHIKLFTANGSYYTSLFMDLSEDEYKDWSTDDNYIRDIVIKKYGFILK